MKKLANNIVQNMIILNCTSFKLHTKNEIDFQKFSGSTNRCLYPNNRYFAPIILFLSDLIIVFRSKLKMIRTDRLIDAWNCLLIGAARDFCVFFFALFMKNKTKPKPGTLETDKLKHSWSFEWLLSNDWFGSCIWCVQFVRYLKLSRHLKYSWFVYLVWVVIVPVRVYVCGDQCGC